MLVELVGGV